LNEVFVKKSYFAAAVLFTSLGLSATAFAQNGPSPGQGDHGGPQEHPGGPAMQGHNGGGHQDQDHGRGHGPQGSPGAQNHDNGRPPMPMHADNGPGHGGPGGPGGARGEGPHDWHRGDRLPDDYRDRQYVVDDYRGYGLHQPPRGYHWVGVNGDYVLAAIATGVIAQIVLSNGH
jgi:Ni/Co efflux regulator RcnB